MTLSPKGIATICDWIQRLMVLYSHGEDALPSQVNMIMKRAEKKDITNGIMLYELSFNPYIDSVDAYYSIFAEAKEKEPNMFGSMGSSGIKTNIVVFNPKENNDIETPFPLSRCNKYGDEIYITLNREMLENKDIKKTIIDLYDVIFDVLLRINRFSLIPDSSYYTIVIFAAIKTMINTDGLKLSDILKDRETEFLRFIPYKVAMFDICEEYIDKTIDFNNTHMIEMISELIEKLEGGDLEMWRYIITSTKESLDTDKEWAELKTTES